MSGDNLDKNYELLTKVEWSGCFTKAIAWSREGDKAIATFGDFEDALWFRGYLEDTYDDTPGKSSAYKKVDTDVTRELRGRFNESYIESRKRSLSDQIEMPARQPMGTPVTIKIPLEIMNEPGLQVIMQQQERRASRNSDGPKAAL